MFRKIVSNLPFSPALVGQLGFYARRLRKEELTRRIGLLFTVLALAVQSLAVFSPPEAANASGYRDYSSNSIISGGALTISELREKYNRSSELQALYAHYGLTSAIINSGNVSVGLSWRNGNITIDGKVVATDGTSLGRHNSSASTPVTIGGNTYYSRTSQTVFLSDTISTFIFTDANGKFIAGIMLACGNPISGKATYVPPKPCQYNAALAANSPDCKAPVGKCKYNTALLETSPDCKPCQYNASLWYKDAKCQPPCKYNSSLLANSADCKACAYNSNIWYKDSRCKAPAASCQTLTRSIIDRTHFRLNGTAKTENGATVKSYVFTVKNATGKVVYSTTVSSNKLTSSTPNFELTATGKYSATLAVETSVGSKTNTGCNTTLEVVAPAVCPLNPALLAKDANCKPCEGDSTIWYKDTECAPKITQEKTVKNLSQGKDATAVTALPGDRIQYTLTVKNTGKAPATQDMIDNLTDVLEYSTLADNGNGVFATAGKTLTWANVTVEPGKSHTRTFMVQVMSTIPTTNTGTANPSSYDCVMTNIFGNKTDVPVQCPTPKVVIETVTQLPHTGPGENMLFAGILFSVVVFFYARSRQLGKEVRLIRRNVNAGTI